MKVRIYISLRKSILDIEGDTLCKILSNDLSYNNIKNIRKGKIIDLELEDNISNLDEFIDEICDKLLVNKIMEEYEYKILD